MRQEGGNSLPLEGSIFVVGSLVLFQGFLAVESLLAFGLCAVEKHLGSIIIIICIF
jgi:hypothetical protein